MESPLDFTGGKEESHSDCGEVCKCSAVQHQCPLLLTFADDLCNLLCNILPLPVPVSPQDQVLATSHLTLKGSLFGGGGAVVNQFPLAGGSNGPLRFAVDLSLSDVFFDPLAARQDVKAVAAARNSRFNDILLQVVALVCLEQARQIGQAGVVNKFAKAFQPDRTLADVSVTITT